MPVVRVSIYKGKSKEHKKAILDGVHEAFVEAFRNPDDDRNQMLVEFDPENFERRPGRTDNFTIVEASIFKGRTPEAKKRLYAGIVSRLAKAPGIDGGDVLIVLNEQPLVNWGVKGGKPASEADLGFDVKV
jgi:phenylpyruvate tautomerase PptA (4-oxalocrotonate tautomerase family)